MRLKECNYYESNVRAVEKMFSYIKKNPIHKKYVISLVKGPISSEVSNFMQNPNDFIEGEILIVKYESLNDCYCNVMKAFLGLNLKLEDNANQFLQKNISKIYSELRKSIKFTKDQLDVVYTLKYVNHFYSLDEVKRFN